MRTISQAVFPATPSPAARGFEPPELRLLLQVIGVPVAVFGLGHRRRRPARRPLRQDLPPELLAHGPCAGKVPGAASIHTERGKSSSSTARSSPRLGTELCTCYNWHVARR